MSRQAPHIKRKVHATVRNPLLIVVIIVTAGWFAWSHYLVSSRHLDRPTANILPDSTFASASTSGNPLTSWSIVKNGGMHIAGSYTKGYITDRSLAVTLSSYQNGNADLSSPAVSLQPNTTYAFKSFYKSTNGFELLAKIGYTNGSSELQLVRTYPTSSTKWSTATDAFKTGTNIKSVQFILRFSGNGVTTLNETYLEKDSDVYVAPQPIILSKNLILNAGLHTVGSAYPEKWATETAGNNLSIPGFVETAAKRFLYVTTAVYKNGSTTWQPAAISVQEGQYYQFSVNYQSNVAADIVASFERDNRTYQFVTIQTVAPATAWTTASANIEVPSHATMMSVSLVLHHRGIISTNNYSLYNITDPGSLQWQNPLVSLTFDGGWESEYQNSLNILHRYKDTGTFYVNPATIGTTNYMSANQLTSLIKGGNELASQGYDFTDLTTVNANQVTTEAQASQSYLQHTFRQPITDFAAPYGNTDAASQTILRKFYKSNRSGLGGVNTKQNFDPYNLRALYISSNTPLSTIQNALTQAKEYNGWLILVYNQIGNTHTNGMVTTATFEKQLAAIQESGLSVKPVNAVLTANQTKP